MLHIHVFFVSPLNTRHMPEPSTDQHQRGVPIGERANYASPPADFAVQAFNDVVRPYSSPVFEGEGRIGQGFFYAVLDLFAASFNFIDRRASTTSLAFARAAALLSWAWIALSILDTSFTLERGTTENTLR